MKALGMAYLKATRSIGRGSCTEKIGLVGPAILFQNLPVPYPISKDSHILGPHEYGFPISPAIEGIEETG
jgi:hypothetical protein